jgi:hypothetical protein
VCLRVIGLYGDVYRKASGKPLALAMEMNTVVALATLKKFIAKKLYLLYFAIK